MPNVTDKELAVARVYSISLLELASSVGKSDVVLEELQQLVELVGKEPQFAAFLESPMVDAEVRRLTIDKVFRGKISDLLVDSLQVLNCRDRLGLLRSVAEAYRLAYQEMRGSVDVYVRTAVELSDELRARIREAAGKHTGKEPRLVETVDGSIIGGVILQIGDSKLDTSVAARLKKLGEGMADRASLEIHSGKSYVVAG